jgi:hypothetical protein
MPTERSDPLTDALDRLYGEPLETFLAKRKELATALRAAGHAEAARAVAAAPKPTRTAWALDQVARREPEAVRAMLAARDAAAEAPGRGDADTLRAALRDYRARVGDVLQRAREVLSAAGFDASAIQLRRMGETLQAASAAGSEARARLQAGTLAHDVGVEDPFAGLDAGAPSARQAEPARDAEPARKAEGARKADAAREARAREEERARRQAAIEAAKVAQRKVDALDAEAREAHAAARAAEAAAARAQKEAERAQRDAERAREAAAEVDSRLERARSEVEALRARSGG